MVRTLVFHTNNVGSIPTGLNMLPLQKTILFYELAKTPSEKTPKATVRYELAFSSIIAPSTSRVGLTPQGNARSPLPRRLLVKRSYLLISWVYYLSASLTKAEADFKPKIAILPARSSLYTLTKAPMAHKTNSKEQFRFKFYNFKFSLNLKVVSRLVPKSAVHTAHALSIVKQTFPVFETNSLFLKNYSVTYPSKDNNFFAKLSLPECYKAKQTT